MVDPERCNSIGDHDESSLRGCIGAEPLALLWLQATWLALHLSNGRHLISLSNFTMTQAQCVYKFYSSQKPEDISLVGAGRNLEICYRHQRDVFCTSAGATHTAADALAEFGLRRPGVVCRGLLIAHR